MNAKAITKSVRFAGGDSIKAEFVKKQANFSKAIDYLVTRYIQEVGPENIEDLSKKRDQTILNALYNINRPQPAMEVPATAAPEKPEPEHAPRGPRAVRDIGFKPSVERTPQSITDLNTSVPSCYL